MVHPAHSSPLGQHTAFTSTYDPKLLYPIERAATRFTPVEFKAGYDVWHAYELSWLDNNGKPQVAIARFVFDAFSPYLVESKSFKLYLNSFNMHRVASTNDLQYTLQQDLTVASGAAVSVTLLGVHDLAISSLPAGAICLDNLPFDASLTNHATSPGQLLQATAHASSIHAHNMWLYSDLLRSVCPVTGQPDWATMLIQISATQVDLKALLAYIVSFRAHSGFHEQCIETMFNDICRYLNPSELMVYGAYTRRGGLDINPCRSLSTSWLMPATRLCRQ